MRRVTVSTPSRLHFGLYALSGGRCAFGGVGAMIESPRVVVRMSESAEFRVTGEHADRAAGFALAAGGLRIDIENEPCHIEVLEAPPQHAGLGLGTQLGLAVASAVDHWVFGEARPPEELAAAVQRGKRSAVGLHGFSHGGLILDGGHSTASAYGALERVVHPPGDWRVLLVTPDTGAGLSGEPERSAFSRLEPIPGETTERLRSIASEGLLDAAERGDFDLFAGSLGEYSRLAGDCFASVQGGTFASPEIAQTVAALNRLGAAGAGQSSWGPTVYAVARDEEHAGRLARDLRAAPGLPAIDCSVTRFSGHGAEVVVEG